VAARYPAPAPIHAGGTTADIRIGYDRRSPLTHKLQSHLVAHGIGRDKILDGIIKEYRIAG
jgi:hypothetical protein